MNPWQTLGLPVRLVLPAEEVEAAFREVSEGAHPDAGGEAGEFEKLREARDVLKDDFRRLEGWLAFHGVERAHSGVVSEDVGAMFVRVNEVTSGVDEWVAKGSAVTSGLGRALWQKEGFACKVKLEGVLDEVATWQERVVGDFSKGENQGAEGDFAEAMRLRGELGFLRKWRQQLQERFGKIWEGLV